MIYQIITFVLLIYTLLVCAVGTFMIYLVESGNVIKAKVVIQQLGMSKEEITRRTSITVNTHFILMLVCIGVLTYGEYNVF